MSSVRSKADKREQETPQKVTKSLSKHQMKTARKLERVSISVSLAHSEMHTAELIIASKGVDMLNEKRDSKHGTRDLRRDT